MTMSMPDRANESQSEFVRAALGLELARRRDVLWMTRIGFAVVVSTWVAVVAAILLAGNGTTTLALVVLHVVGAPLGWLVRRSS